MPLQVALAPLEIYNDVQSCAAVDLGADHLTGQAQADAEACLRKLIVQLATQVQEPSACLTVYSCQYTRA